jgi:hypothetical protein
MHNPDPAARRGKKRTTWLVVLAVAMAAFVIFAFWNTSFHTAANIVVAVSLVVSAAFAWFHFWKLKPSQIGIHLPTPDMTGPQPPQWVVLGLRRITGAGAPPNSDADRIMDLQPGSGRFMKNPCGSLDRADESIVVAEDSRLTDDDTGFYIFRTNLGRYWLLAAADALPNLGRLDLSVTAIRARVLIRNRSVSTK